MAVTFSKEEQAALDAAGAAWNAANAKGDKAGMDAAHAAAEAIRAGKGYSGGADGSQYIALNSGTSNKNSSGNSQYTASDPGGVDNYHAKYTANYGAGMTQSDLSTLEYYGDMWNAATSEADKTYWHNKAEQLREKYGYTGGGDGSEYVELPAVQQKVGSFNYDSAPTYTDPYSQRIDEMLNQILNRDKFSYDATTDPLYAQYRDQYHREGQLAMEDTLGQIAARTGGMASSYAQTAAQQVYQGYAQQLADKIPELYQLAYEMYLDDIDLQVQDLGLLENASDRSYGRYRDTMAAWRDDRDFAYGVYRDDIADNQWQTGFDRDVFESDRDYNYGLERDKIEDARYDEEWAHQVAQDALAQSNWEKEFGLTEDKFSYQQAQDAASGSGSSGGGSGGGSGSSNKGGSGSTSYNNGGLSSSQVKALQKALGVSQDGYYGPNTKKAAGGLSADAAYKKFVGGNNSGNDNGNSGSGTAAAAGMELGIGPTNAQFIQELAAYGGIVEQSNGKFAWSAGWDAKNYRDKLAQAKNYNPFGSILSIL